MSENKLIQVYRTDTKITNENFAELNELNITYTKVTNDIKRNVKSIFNNFLEIAALLHEAKEKEIYKWVDYKDIYEYAQNEFDLGKTSVKNYIQIAEKCLESKDEEENLRIGILKENYKDYNYSQLVELLTVPELDLEKYNPKMSVRQIRQNKYEESFKDYLNNLTNLENDDSEINYVIKELKETLHGVYPDEELTYKKLPWSFFGLKFFINKKENLIEFTISKYYDNEVQFSVSGSGFKRFNILNEALDYAKEDILVQAKKRIEERQEKESQTSDQEDNINDHVESQTFDQENEVVEVKEFRTGTWDEFLNESDFTEEASTYLIETIASTFGHCQFEWYPDNYNLKIILNDDCYLLLNYEGSSYWDEHRLDFRIKLMDSEDNSLIKEYTINSLFKQILMELA